jgi:hypothetical protein
MLARKGYSSGVALGVVRDALAAERAQDDGATVPPSDAYLGDGEHDRRLLDSSVICP